MEKTLGINAQLRMLADRLSGDDAKLVRAAANHIDGLRGIISEANNAFAKLNEICRGANYEITIQHARLDAVVSRPLTPVT